MPAERVNVYLISWIFVEGYKLLRESDFLFYFFPVNQDKHTEAEL